MGRTSAGIVISNVTHKMSKVTGKIMRRPIHMAMERHDFRCRVCNIRWSAFVQTNSLCTKSSGGDGIHNFDFGKPIRIAPREYPVRAVNTQEDQK